jgi:hypothetical protein
MQNAKVAPINSIANEEYKTICNGFGASENTVEKILNVREFGLIELDLCNKYVNRFNIQAVERPN